MVRTKRVYEPAARSDGYRVLAERLWPRGLSREAAHLDLWAKDLAPSQGLRLWYGHDPLRFSEFIERYRQELARSPAREAFLELLRLAAHGPVTLVFASRDEVHSCAAVLKHELDEALGEQQGGGLRS